MLKTDLCTHIIHTTVSALYYSNMFRPSKGHLQGAQMINFHNKMGTRCKIQFTEQRVLCSKHCNYLPVILPRIATFFISFIQLFIKSLFF